MIWSVGGDVGRSSQKPSQEVIILDDSPNVAIQSAVLCAFRAW